MLSLTLFLSISLYVSPTSAFWRLLCDNPITVARMDPIVNPGAVAGHVHSVVGGSNFATLTNFDSLRASTCTSCQVQQDMSNYWTPLLYYQHSDGRFQDVQTVGGLTAYYLQRGAGDTTKPGEILAFPPGFQMLAGNPTLRASGTSLEQQAINYVCLDFIGGSSQWEGLPPKKCPQGLRAQVAFPSCWDGVNLDSPDHKSHMAYPSGVTTGSCPSSHPKRLVTLFYEVTYNVDSFSSMWYNPGKSPFVLSMGDPTGYGFHGDFINGWDVQVLQTAINNCTAQSGLLQDCPIFDLVTNQNCHQAPQINEIVTGILPSLPGCNAVQPGSAVATKQKCPGSTPPQIWNQTLGFKGSVVPPGANVLAGTPRVLYNHSTWKTLGCMSDTPSRTLSNGVNVPGGSRNMTVQSCLTACNAGNFKYAGLEYGQECWCSNFIAPASKALDFQSCDVPCTGDTTTLCGGGLALQVYNNTAAIAPFIPLASTDKQYIFGGCFKDNPNRVMRFAAPNSNGTVDGCVASCASRGYPFAGIQYGGECWCDSIAPPQSLKSSDEECSMYCNGNKQNFCGAGFRLQMYAANSAIAKSSSTPTSTSTSTAVQAAATASAGSPEGIPLAVMYYKYSGCFSDSTSGRILRNQLANNGTIEGCAAAASAVGFSMFGLEYGGECWADSLLASSSVNANSDCSMRCTSSPSNFCGAANRLQVYQSTLTAGIPKTVANYNYQGCYTDDGNRVMRQVLGTANQTVSACVAACSKAGYTLAGIEYGGQCFCDSTLASRSSVAPGGDVDCGMICNDSRSEFCGGAFKLQLYSSIFQPRMFAQFHAPVRSSSFLTSKSSTSTTGTSTGRPSASLVVSTTSATNARRSSSSTSRSSSRPATYRISLVSTKATRGGTTFRSSFSTLQARLSTSTATSSTTVPSRSTSLSSSAGASDVPRDTTRVGTALSTRLPSSSTSPVPAAITSSVSSSTSSTATNLISSSVLR